MVTIMSNFTPNQIIKEDYIMMNRENHPHFNDEARNICIITIWFFEEDEHDVYASFCYIMFCRREDDKVVETKDSVKFTTYRLPSKIIEKFLLHILNSEIIEKMMTM